MLALLAALSIPVQTVRVFAAASLKEAFTAIARNYERSHAGSKVQLNFAGSQLLAAQIRQGAPADVFASAAQKNLDQVPHENDGRRIFAMNRLAIATRRGVRNIASVRDLANAREIVIADASVPVGRYTQSFLDSAGKQFGVGWLRSVRAKVVSREVDVKSVLAKVRLGEADAGIVYSSDIVTAKGQVGRVDIPENLNEIALYPIAPLTYAENASGAKDFIKFLFTAESQRALEANGFVSPLRPTKILWIQYGDEIMPLGLPLSSGYKVIAVKAVDDTKLTRTYHGILVTDVVRAQRSRKLTFEAADGYSRSIDLAVLRSKKGIFVRQPDGNYQIVVPGVKPSMWVKWLRRIRVD